MTMQQEIRPGYKQTEVGLIPEDWDVKTLKEVCRQIVDGTHFTPTYTRDGVPFYSVENVTSDNFNDVKFISEKDSEIQNKRCRPERGDILMTRIGSLADTRLIDWDVHASIYVSLALLKVGPVVDPLFLYAHTKSATFKRCVENRSLLSAIPKKINMGAIGDVPVPVPSSNTEQRAIAAALSDADALIAVLEGMIVKKRDLKQAAMQNLLTGKTRLPGFSGEWELKTLGEVAAIRNHKINTFGANAAAFCVELEQVGQNTGQIDGHSDARSRRSVKYLFQKDDVLFGRLRPYLRKFWCADREGVCSTEIWPLIPIGTRLVSSFLFQTVQSDAFIEAANSSYGTHMPRSDWKALTKFELRLPLDPIEQAAIAEVLSDMDADLAALEAQVAKARAVKQGMMQELLTGRVRLV